MTVIPEGYAQVNFQYTGDDVPTGAEWTLGLFLEGTGATPVEIAEELFDAYDGTLLKQYIGSGCDLSSILCKVGPDTTGPSAVVPVVGGSTGGTSSSPNCATLVKKITNQGGRAGRGRMFFPSPPESNVDSAGFILPAIVTAMQTQLDAFYTAIGTGSFSPVVLHGVGSPITTPSLITSFQVDPKSATQRRRLRR